MHATNSTGETAAAATVFSSLDLVQRTAERRPDLLPAKAVSTVLADLDITPGSNLVAVVSGGNNDVSRYAEIVERALQKFGRPIYVRHEIVHNTYVVNDLKAKGAIFIEDLADVPPGASVLLVDDLVGEVREVARKGRTGTVALRALLAERGIDAAVLNAKNDADEAIKKFTGGKTPVEGKVKLDLPEIAENGNTVPVSVEAEGATEILMLATGNPTPGVMVASFGPAAGKHALATRIRLAKTQDVMAIAKFADGKVVRAKSNVKVTIGGCGG